jgi:hypothetical protein
MVVLTQPEKISSEQHYRIAANLLCLSLRSGASHREKSKAAVVLTRWVDHAQLDLKELLTTCAGAAVEDADDGWLEQCFSRSIVKLQLRAGRYAGATIGHIARRDPLYLLASLLSCHVDLGGLHLGLADELGIPQIRGSSLIPPINRPSPRAFAREMQLA